MNVGKPVDYKIAIVNKTKLYLQLLLLKCSVLLQAIDL